MCKHAQMMQRIRMCWLLSEDLPVKPLCFAQSPGLMMLQCEGEGLLGRGGHIVNRRIEYPAGEPPSQDDAACPARFGRNAVRG
jgi:hypothetical protein